MRHQTSGKFHAALNFSSNWRKKEFNTVKPLEAFDIENPKHWQAILRLDTQYRAVIELKLLEYSNAEIAEILDEPLGSVNSWYTRGIHILRDRLKDLHTTGKGDGLLK